MIKARQIVPISHETRPSTQLYKIVQKKQPNTNRLYRAIYDSNQSIYNKDILYLFSRFILVYYCKCCDLIGYSTRYLFLDKEQVAKQSSS